MPPCRTKRSISCGRWDSRLRLGDQGVTVPAYRPASRATMRLEVTCFKGARRSQ